LSRGLLYADTAVERFRVRELAADLDGLDDVVARCRPTASLGCRTRVRLPDRRSRLSPSAPTDFQLPHPEAHNERVGVMSDHELSLEESDARRREAIAAAEQAVLELVKQTKAASPQELRNALVHANLDVDPATLRTALLRLLNQGLFGERHTAAAAQ
jgi:hypothetical protein